MSKDTSWAKSKHDWKGLQRVLGYEFKQEELLQQALTHCSYVNESKKHRGFHSYERLEFLGDAVLELIISHHLWHTYPDLPEGDLTRMRAALVKRPTLAAVARRLSLSKLIRLGKGERLHGGEERSSLLADIVESILAAVYLDGGLNAARLVCFRLMAPELKNLDPSQIRNHKNLLQEIASQMSLPAPTYKLISSEGPEHEPIFCMEVRLNPTFHSTGQGPSKKEATQQAARSLYQRLRALQDNPPTTLPKKIQNLEQITPSEGLTDVPHSGTIKHSPTQDETSEMIEDVGSNSPTPSKDENKT